MRIAPGTVPSSAPRQSTPGDNKDRFGLAKRELTASFIEAPPGPVMARPGSTGAGVVGPVATETVVVKGKDGEPGTNGTNGKDLTFGTVQRKSDNYQMLVTDSWVIVTVGGSVGSGSG